MKNLEIDKKTGEIFSPENVLYLNEEKIKQEETFDGYYVLITSKYKESAD